ncbi:39S ribosomal protein L44, mitochondrial [Ceratocystis pirilliformis]|uniref:Large ribosomal subunit protein mL53 n=1 Tax=Ceratocystis pirilliformis TaxID=259994 RepID=A0ABR3ZNL5_9PEZI
MITKFMTQITSRVNPFSRASRSTRLFLSQIPPNARVEGLVVNNTVLPQDSVEKPLLQVKFKDGRVMDLDCMGTNIKGLVEEVDRHSRALQKKADIQDA